MTSTICPSGCYFSRPDEKASGVGAQHSPLSETNMRRIEIIKRKTCSKVTQQRCSSSWSTYWRGQPPWACRSWSSTAMRPCFYMIITWRNQISYLDHVCTGWILTYAARWITQRWSQCFARRAPQRKRQRRVLRTIYITKLSKTYSGQLRDAFLMILWIFDFSQNLLHGDTKLTKFRTHIWGITAMRPCFYMIITWRNQISYLDHVCTGWILTYAARWITQRWSQCFARRAPQRKRQRRVLRTIYITKLSKTYSGRLWNSCLMIRGLFGFSRLFVHEGPNLQSRRSFSKQITVWNHQSGR